VETGWRIDFARQHGLDGLSDLASLGGLRDEALRAVAQRAGDGLRVVIRRDDDHGQAGPAAAHVRERIEAVCARHVQVEQQQICVGVRLERRKQRRDRVGLDEAGAGVEPADRGLEGLAKQGMIVCHDDLSRHGAQPIPRALRVAGRAGSTNGEYPAPCARAQHPGSSTTGDR
jgi:septum formation topological specificity factor MinE